MHRSPATGAPASDASAPATAPRLTHPNVTPYIKPSSPHRAPSHAGCDSDAGAGPAHPVQQRELPGLPRAQTMVVANPSASLTAPLTRAAIISAVESSYLPASSRGGDPGCREEDDQRAEPRRSTRQPRLRDEPAAGAPLAVDAVLSRGSNVYPAPICSMRNGDPTRVATTANVARSSRVRSRGVSRRSSCMRISAAAVMPSRLRPSRTSAPRAATLDASRAPVFPSPRWPRSRCIPPPERQETRAAPLRQSPRPLPSRAEPPQGPGRG